MDDARAAGEAGLIERPLTNPVLLLAGTVGLAIVLRALARLLR